MVVWFSMREHMTSIENNSSFIYYISIMTPAQRRIASVLTDFHAQVIHKKKEAVFPSMNTIATIAKCSPGSVKLFIRKFKTLIFTHQTRRNHQTKRHTSNLYKLDPIFFETMIMLRYLRIWEMTDDNYQDIILKSSEDPSFLCRKVLQRHDLSTAKLSTAILYELPTIKIFSYSYNPNKGTLKGSVPISFVQKNPIGILQGLALTKNQAMKLINDYSPNALWEAKKDYDWFRKKNRVKYPFELYRNLVQKQQRKIA